MAEDADMFGDVDAVMVPVAPSVDAVSMPGAEIKPHRDFEHVILQQHGVSGRYCVAHKGTGESLMLSPGVWDLMEIDGFACLTMYDQEADDDAEPTADYAADMFRWQVFEHGDGSDGDGSGCFE
jgi:hypothetical protein